MFSAQSLKKFVQTSAMRRGMALGLLSMGLLGIQACSTPPRPPITDEQFAADWRSHTHPLFLKGRALSADRNSWWVPRNLPSGSYRVIARHGDHAELIDGAHFEVTPGSFAEIHLLIEMSYSDVEAIDEKFIQRS